MSEFSLLIGSFLRVGNFPMEANFIFNSIEELNDWAAQPLNHATLHPGLQKIVQGEEGQRLYWVVKKDGDLVFERYFCTSLEEEADKHFDLMDTEFQKEKEGILLTLKLGSEVWNEFLPMSDVIHLILDSFSELFEKQESVMQMARLIKTLEGQVQALIASAGIRVDNIEVLYFRFVGKGNATTYIVDTSKLTDEQKQNGLDIPIMWEYNVSLYGSDKQYIILNGILQEEGPAGDALTYTLKGIKDSTTVQIFGISKATGKTVKSLVLRILFGLLFYVGLVDSNTPSADTISSLPLVTLTPIIGENDSTSVSLTFTATTSDGYRLFAAPKPTFDNIKLYQTIGNTLCEIVGYSKTTVTIGDMDYIVCRFNNKIHGNYTITVANNNLI